MNAAAPSAIRNQTFDRLRGAGAVMVVLIHAPPLLHSTVPSLRMAGWILREACQLAVPFFLILSGFLLGRKWRGGRRGWTDLGTTLGRLGTLYLPWFALFLSLDAWRDLPHDPTTVLRRLVGFSASGPDTTGYHLWFLPSLALAQVVAWTSLRWTRSVIPALVLGIALFAWMYAREILRLPVPFGMVATEGLNLSLSAVGIGVLLGLADKHWSPPGWVVVATIVGMFLEGAVLRNSFPGKDPVFTFQWMRLAAPTCLLLWAIAHPRTGRMPFRSLADLLGRHATAIYVSHLAFLLLVPFDGLVANGFLRDNLVRWPSAICGAIGLSMVVRRWGGKHLRRLVE